MELCINCDTQYYGKYGAAHPKRVQIGRLSRQKSGLEIIQKT